MPNDNADRRVIEALEAELGRRTPGERLPSVRELMKQLNVGPVTVQRAVAHLAAQGLVEPRPGKGTFVARPTRTPLRRLAEAPDLAWQSVALGPSTPSAGALDDLLRPPPQDAYVLSSGYLPQDLQPDGPLANALARAARRPGAWNRVAVEGTLALRQTFAAMIGAGVEPHDVLVCPGGQSALSTALKVLAGPGGAVAMESPTYLGAIVCARALGLRVIPVPADEHGVRPDLLHEALVKSGARAYYAQPCFANPTGTTLATERRAEVLAAVRSAGAFLIEDDTFRDFVLEGAAPPPLAAEDGLGHVVHLRSMTKSAAPGLRIAALAARGPALNRLRQARLAEEFFVAGALQEAAVELAGSPSWNRHLKRVRAELRVRRDMLADAVETHLGLVPARPRGGMHLWLALTPEEDDMVLHQEAARRGVVITPGTPWFPADAPGPFIRLTYASDTPERLARGVELLAEARATLLTRRAAA